MFRSYFHFCPSGAIYSENRFPSFGGGFMIAAPPPTPESISSTIALLLLYSDPLLIHPNFLTFHGQGLLVSRWEFSSIKFFLNKHHDRCVCYRDLKQHEFLVLSMVGVSLNTVCMKEGKNKWMNESNLHQTQVPCRCCSEKESEPLAWIFQLD